jgi:hypothetical protein
MLQSLPQLKAQSVNSLHPDLIDKVENQRRLGFLSVALGVIGSTYCLAFVLDPKHSNIELCLALLLFAVLAALLLIPYGSHILATASHWALRASWLYRNGQTRDLTLQSIGNRLQLYETNQPVGSIPLAEISICQSPPCHKMLVTSNQSDSPLLIKDIVSIRCDLFCGGAVVIETIQGRIWGRIEKSKFLPPVKNLLAAYSNQDLHARLNSIWAMRAVFIMKSTAIIGIFLFCDSAMLFNVWFQLLFSVLIICLVNIFSIERAAEASSQQRILSGKPSLYGFEGDLTILAILAQQQNLQERADLCNKALMELEKLSPAQKVNYCQASLNIHLIGEEQSLAL